MKTQCPNGCGCVLTSQNPRCPNCGAEKHREKLLKDKYDRIINRVNPKVCALMIDRSASDEIYQCMVERGLV